MSLVYRNKIDIIYIDPPYNTERSASEGNNQESYKEERKSSRLIYKNKYGRTAWLNLMYERLILAKDLMKDDALIFVAIDDAEQAYLKVIMDEIFKEENFISCMPIKTQVGRIVNGVSRAHEYVLVYAKNRRNDQIFYEEKSEAEKIKHRPFINGGETAFAAIRPRRFFPILEKNNQLFMISDDDYKKIYDGKKDADKNAIFNEVFIEKLQSLYKGYKLIWPINTSGKRMTWSHEFQRTKREINDRTLRYDPRLNQIYLIRSYKQFSTWLDGKQFNNTFQGVKVLDKILGKNVFDYPKSVKSIEHFIKMLENNEEAIILDFFAGSGSTAHAVLNLNQEDGGNRSFILCTNNENDIAWKVTYERLHRIIKGTTSHGDKNFEWIKDNEPYTDVKVRVIEIDNTQKIDFEGNDQDKVIEKALEGIELLDSNFDKNLTQEQVYYELSALNPLKNEEETKAEIVE